MASVVATDSFLVVTCGPRVLGVQMHEKQPKVLEIYCTKDSKTEVFVEDTCGTKDTSTYVVATDVSRCSKWLALCSSNKQLSLWETVNWSLVSNRPLERAAAKVKFLPSSTSLVVADRSGDAYLFSVQEPHNEGKLILGHMSMLLNVLITDDEKFILTCDRDEKIRVSCFPNAYNIQSYCLGHKEFVSSLSFLSHKSSVLVSGSGDGTVRFWDYMTGKQEEVMNCSYLVKINKKCDTGSKDMGAELAVTQVACCLANSISSIVVVCVENLTGCIVFTVTGEKNSLVCTLREIVQFAAAPWDVHLASCGLLWSVVNCEREPFGGVWLASDHSEDNSNLQAKIKQTVALINELREYFSHLQPPHVNNILYKRKVDNLHEYFAKKKAKGASAAS